MKLHQLYENFGEATPEKQQEYIAAYRLRRAQDMEKPSTFKKKRASVSTTPKPVLSEEEKMLAKLLGLKQKDILALRNVAEVEETVSGDEELLTDSTFEGGEEDE